MGGVVHQVFRNRTAGYARTHFFAKISSTATRRSVADRTKNARGNRARSSFRPHRLFGMGGGRAGAGASRPRRRPSRNDGETQRHPVVAAKPACEENRLSASSGLPVRLTIYWRSKHTSQLTIPSPPAVWRNTSSNEQNCFANILSWDVLRHLANREGWF